MTRAFVLECKVTNNQMQSKKDNEDFALFRRYYAFLYNDFRATIATPM
jgi:hypothetical protein